MTVLGPIIVADSDAEDQQLFQQALESVAFPNQLLFFRDGREVLDYLLSGRESPWIIISDIRLAGMDGLKLREAINADKQLKKRSIPFVFLTEVAYPHEVAEAYRLNVQGFFIKQNSIESLEHILRVILHYWKHSVEPNHS